MKRTLIIFLSLIPLFAMAQEPQTIGGYLLDGKDSFEELEAAVLTESRSKAKRLGGKGMKMPGGVMMMTPRSIGIEIGSIRIYRIHDENNLENIVTMPIYQEIPKTGKKTVFSIAPEESILLEPGKYYVSFAVTEIGNEIMERWADSDTWSDKEQSTRYMEDRMYFPLYLKTSYTRGNTDHPLTRWGANIGIEVMGIERR